MIVGYARRYGVVLIIWPVAMRGKNTLMIDDPRTIYIIIYFGALLGCEEEKYLIRIS